MLDDGKWEKELTEEEHQERQQLKVNRPKRRRILIEEEEEEEEEVKVKVVPGMPVHLLGQIFQHQITSQGQLVFQVKWQSYSNKFNRWAIFGELVTKPENVPFVEKYLAANLKK